MIPNRSLRLPKAPDDASTSDPSSPTPSAAPPSDRCASPTDFIVSNGATSRSPAPNVPGRNLPRLRGTDRGRWFGRGGRPVLREPGAATARGTLLPVPLGEGREGQGRAPS